MYVNINQQNQNDLLNQQSIIIQIGKKKLKVLSKFGINSFGQLFIVEDISTQQEYCLKCQSFISSAELQLTLEMKEHNFKNLLNVIDYYFDGKNHYILLEKYEGDMYKLYVQKKKMTNDEFRYIALEIAKGIKEVHDWGLIHRNIKPENIMVQRNIDQVTRNSSYKYKLGNFGLVKEEQSAQTQFQGTWHYFAPEELQGFNSHYSFPVDIWAFGAVLYELCSQKMLFDGSIEEIQKNIKQLNIEPLINQLQINVDYKQLLLEMLNRNPQKRPTINQIINKLTPQLRVFKSVEQQKVNLQIPKKVNIIPLNKQANNEQQKSNQVEIKNQNQIKVQAPRIISIKSVEQVTPQVKQQEDQGLDKTVVLHKQYKGNDLMMQTAKKNEQSANNQMLDDERGNHRFGDKQRICFLSPQVQRQKF